MRETFNTDYREHVRQRLEGKSRTSKRFEVEGLIVKRSDLGFGGTDLEITDLICLTVEAESLERAIEITIEEMEIVQSHTGMDDRKENYYSVKQVD